MKFFRRLSVGGKLAGAFMGLLAITMVIGTGAIFQLGRVNDKSRDLAENWMPAGITAVQLAHYATRYRTTEYLLVTSRDAASVQRAQGMLQAGLKPVAQYRAAYEKLISSPEDRALYAQFAKAWDAYLAYGQTQLLPKVLAGHPEAARDQMVGEGFGVFNQVTQSLAALEKFNTENGRQTRAEAGTLHSQSRTVLITLMTLGLALGTVLAVLITRMITRPLGDAVSLAQAVALGDLTRRARATSGADELAQLSRALDAMVLTLGEVVAQVRHGVESVSSASSEIAAGNQDLSSRTEQAASNLQHTACAMEQITVTVQQSVDLARQANQVADVAAGAAEQGGKVMSQVVGSMAQISASSKKITDIIGVIDGIAFQTNILALNAAVEAARAGEQGRGFAVVANEVRTLAQRSADAAREVRVLIGVSVQQVDSGVQLVQAAGSSMGDIVSSVRNVTRMMSQITSAAAEQHQGIAQVSQAVDNLDHIAQQNAALVEQSAAAAASLSDQARRLASVVSVFRVTGLAASRPA